MKKIYYYKETRSKRKKKRLIVIPFFLVVTGLLISTGILFYKNSPKRQDVLAAENVPEAKPVPTVYNNILKQSVDNALRGTTGSYGIVVKNLDTGEQYEFNEHVEYDTASLYKLWVMAVVFEQIENNKLKLTSILSQDVDVLNKKFNIASDSAGLSDGTVTHTVADALEKMITISDNYAAMLLTQKVGLNTISSYLQKNGFYETKMGTNTNLPTTTPSDVALFLEKLYRGELGSKQSTQQMLELLKNQQLNGKIPRYLPDDIVIAHKTGELDEYTHDAGLILDKRGNYLLVIMSKSEQPDLSANRIADISKAIYSHYIDKKD